MALLDKVTVCRLCDVLAGNTHLSLCEKHMTICLCIDGQNYGRLVGVLTSEKIGPLRTHPRLCYNMHSLNEHIGECL